MSESIGASEPVASAAGAGTGSFRLYRHVVIGLAIALLAPFTALAWPVAIVLGIVIGVDDVDRRRQVKPAASVTVVRVLAVTGGILAMFFFGAIIGALIALPIVALAALSERAAADAEPVDRIVARLVIIVLPVLAYIAMLALGVNIDIRFGA
jgi:hypothetical protein